MPVPHLPPEILLQIAEDSLSLIADEVQEYGLPPELVPKYRRQLWNLCMTNSLFCDLTRPKLFKATRLLVSPEDIRRDAEVLTAEHVATKIKSLKLYMELRSQVEKEDAEKTLGVLRGSDSEDDDGISKADSTMNSGSDEDLDIFLGGDLPPDSLEGVELKNNHMVLDVANWATTVGVNLGQILTACAPNLEHICIDSQGTSFFVYSYVLHSTIVEVLSSQHFPQLRRFTLDTDSIGKALSLWQRPTNDIFNGNMARLEELNLGPDIQDRHVETRHEAVDVHDFEIWLGGLKQLKKLTVTLSSIRYIDNRRITALNAAALTPLSSLVSLGLHRMRISDSLSAALSELLALEKLELDRVLVDRLQDSWVEVLEVLPVLGRLRSVRLCLLRYFMRVIATGGPVHSDSCRVTVCSPFERDGDALAETEYKLRSRGVALEYSKGTDRWTTCNP